MRERGVEEVYNKRSTNTIATNEIATNAFGQSPTTMEGHLQGILAREGEVGEADGGAGGGLERGGGGWVVLEDCGCPGVHSVCRGSR